MVINQNQTFEDFFTEVYSFLQMHYKEHEVKTRSNLIIAKWLMKNFHILKFLAMTQNEIWRDENVEKKQMFSGNNTNEKA